MKEEKETFRKIVDSAEEWLKPHIKWRIGAGLGKNKEKGKAMALQYIDARALQRFLDEKFGPECWWDEYFSVKETLFCRLTIKHGPEIVDTVSKCGAGEESNTSPKKGEESDAFKRACFKFGFGRHLYEAQSVWVDAKKQGNKTLAYFVKDNKEIIIYDLSKHINGMFKQNNYELSTDQGVLPEGEELKKPSKKEIEQQDHQSLVDEILRKGGQFPELMENIITHCGTELSLPSLDEVPTDQLQKYLARIEKEMKDKGSIHDFKTNE